MTTLNSNVAFSIQEIEGKSRILWRLSSNVSHVLQKQYFLTYFRAKYSSYQMLIVSTNESQKDLHFFTKLFCLRKGNFSANFTSLKDISLGFCFQLFLPRIISLHFMFQNPHTHSSDLVVRNNAVEVRET